MADNRVMKSTSSGELEVYFGDKIFRKPTSPSMPFIQLFHALTQTEPRGKIAEIMKFYKNYAERQISRKELIRLLGELVGVESRLSKIMMKRAMSDNRVMKSTSSGADNRVMKSTSSGEVEVYFGDNNFRKPTSPSMPFIQLFHSLTQTEPKGKITEIVKFYKNYVERQISRREGKFHAGN